MSSKFLLASSRMGMAAVRISSAFFYSSAICTLSISSYFFFYEASIWALDATSDFSLISSKSASTSAFSALTSIYFFSNSACSTSTYSEAN